MTELLIESFSCRQCGNPTFYIFRVENEIHTTCKECGNIVELETIRKQLVMAKQELKK